MPSVALHVPKARWRAALLLSCAVFACGESEADPLDPDEVKQAAQAEGDAQGVDRSGVYYVELGMASGCDCPPVMMVDLCTNDLTTLASTGGFVTLTQSDGYLVISEQAGLLNLSGALQADGAFDLAGVYGFGSVLGELGVYVRLTGRFTDDEHFTANVSSRALGDFDDEAIDCRNDVDLLGAREVLP